MSAVATVTAQTSRRMAAVRSRNTTPELRLRRALHARGLRYRIHPRDVPGQPDLANLEPQARRVRGRRLLRHANPEAWKRRGMTSLGEQFPADRRAYWTQKLQRNRARDGEVNATLAARGWRSFACGSRTLVATVEAIADQIANQW